MRGRERNQVRRRREIGACELIFIGSTSVSGLQIRLFGSVRLAHDSWHSPVKLTRTVGSLLAYLVLQRHRPHTREELAGIFWGDHNEDRARGDLSTALWRLRLVLERAGVPRGTYLVCTPMGEVAFNRDSDYWLDVAAFEEQLGEAVTGPIDTLKPAGAERLESALELYTGDLLEGFYDEWALAERERLRCLYLNRLAFLMRYYKHTGSYEQSVLYGQRILANDPLREDIHREMMRLYVESGQRPLAVRQYESCREILARELGISPMEETETLYARMFPSAADLGTGSNTPAEPRPLRQAMQQLRLAIQRFDKARDHLEHAMLVVEGAPDGGNPCRPRVRRSTHLPSKKEA